MSANKGQSWFLGASFLLMSLMNFTNEGSQNSDQKSQEKSPQTNYHKVHKVHKVHHKVDDENYHEDHDEGYDHLVRLFDGSALHGKMSSLNPSQGLFWKHKDAFSNLQFSFSTLASIRFDTKQKWEMRQEQCRFRFTNGDEIYGKIISMNSHFIEMETGFGGRLRADREKVESIALLQNGYRVLYEGPNSMKEWVRGKNPNGWSYEDGILNVKGRGVIGRNVGIEDSANLSFDVKWEGSFQLSITMHAETLDRYDYAKGAYVFSLNPQFASFQRIAPGAGTMTLGQVRLTNLLSRTRARFDLRTHRESARFAILIDGERIGNWKDSRGFIAKGKGMTFSSQATRSAFSMSRILLTEWDGHFESDFNIDDKNEDQIDEDQIDEDHNDHNDQNDHDGLLLINRDQPKGTIEDIAEGNLNFNLRHRLKVKIPIERIMLIRLRQAKKRRDPFAENEVRVQISGGGSLSFILDRWTDSMIEGTSKTFGSVLLKPESIRSVEMNLEQHWLSRSGNEEPEDVWDFEAK